MKAAVFAAMDRTLLDATTVARLRARGIEVIPVSEMTLDELAPVARELGLERAMIIESGGAIARWNGRQWDVEPCGPSMEMLLEAVREIEDRSGASLFVDVGLDNERRFSERFVIESGDLAAVEHAAAELGFGVRRGPHFLHLTRVCDEGEAFARLRAELGCELTIGVGGLAADAEFLSRTDVAIITPGPDGLVDSELAARVPHARIADAGWAAAVEDASPLYGMGRGARVR